MAELPDNCIGHEQSTRCIYYEETGESLDSIIERLDSNQSASESISQGTLTTDDVITTSLVRNTASLCSSQIVTRDFTYTLSATKNTTSLGWDLTGIARTLPKGYSVAAVRVKATGKKENKSAIIGDSSSISAAFPLGLDRYPVTLDFSIRVTAPCGNIDLERSVLLTTPTNTGTYRVIFNVQDLVEGSGVDLMLTQQLDSLEARVFQLGAELDNFGEINTKGVKEDIKTKVISQQAQIDELEAQVSAADSFSIEYTKDGTKQTNTLSSIITDIYAEIKAIKDRVTQNEVDIAAI